MLRNISQGLGLVMFFWAGQGEVAGACACGNEHAASTKCGEFLDWLRTG